MATNKGVKKFGTTVGKNDKLTSGLIKAGTAVTKRTTKQTNQDKPGAPKVSSYREYLDMTPETVSRLTTTELRGVVARLNKIESKRLKNLEKYGFGAEGFNTQAFRDLSESGGKTSATVGMSRQELLHEYKRAKAFLSAETSTVAGSKRFIKDIETAIGAKEPMTKDEISTLFEIYHDYEESGALAFYKKGEKNHAGYQEARKIQSDIYTMLHDKKMTKEQVMVELGLLTETEVEAGTSTSESFNWSGYHHP